MSFGNPVVLAAVFYKTIFPSTILLNAIVIKLLTEEPGIYTPFIVKVQNPVSIFSLAPKTTIAMLQLYYIDIVTNF